MVVVIVLVVIVEVSSTRVFDISIYIAVTLVVTASLVVPHFVTLFLPSVDPVWMLVHIHNIVEESYI